MVPVFSFSSDHVIVTLVFHSIHGFHKKVCRFHSTICWWRAVPAASAPSCFILCVRTQSGFETLHIKDRCSLEKVCLWWKIAAWMSSLCFQQQCLLVFLWDYMETFLVAQKNWHRSALTEFNCLSAIIRLFFLSTSLSECSLQWLQGLFSNAACHVYGDCRGRLFVSLHLVKLLNMHLPGCQLQLEERNVSPDLTD